tara:strand:- start:103046 stop:103756 length:711 start_codon:yes stop_codon:yes gene_type:complete
MARLARLVVPHHAHHIIQQGNDQQLIFRETADYMVFLDWLRDAARQFKVAIHAYVLMPSQLQLLATPSDVEGLSRLMQWVGRHYVPYFNRKYQRSGTLWQGRFKATVIDADHYLMMCCRYIELSPVHEGLVSQADDYPWSSYPHHIGTRSDLLISDHVLYWALGNTPFQREAAYKAQIAQGIADNDRRALVNATAKGWVLGSEAFKTALEKLTRRRVRQVKRGRPPRQLPVKDGGL